MSQVEDPRSEGLSDHDAAKVGRLLLAAERMAAELVAEAERRADGTVATGVVADRVAGPGFDPAFTGGVVEIERHIAAAIAEVAEAESRTVRRFGQLEELLRRQRDLIEESGQPGPATDPAPDVSSTDGPDPSPPGTGRLLTVLWDADAPQVAIPAPCDEPSAPGQEEGVDVPPPAPARPTEASAEEAPRPTPLHAEGVHPLVAPSEGDKQPKHLKRSTGRRRGWTRGVADGGAVVITLGVALEIARHV